MEVLTSPQLIAAGEGKQIIDEKNHGGNNSYAFMLNEQKSFKTLDLCPISMEQGIPTVEFTVDEVNTFTREEGLHQAVILKFSYGKPELQDLRLLVPKHFEVKGMCNTGQLEYRHILVRFDSFEDYANVVSKSAGYIKSKGDDFFFRTFPWTMDFNPREETPKAVTWISFPELPANLFAKKSLLSIASVAGKPIAIDKATQDRTRPSTARVKILVNLLDKHPKKTKIKIFDEKSGKIIEFDQRVVFDNLPKYCTYCNHQGHDVHSCRWISDEFNDQVGESVNQINVVKLKGDAREYLNSNRIKRQVSPQSVVPALTCPEHPNDSIVSDPAGKSVQQKPKHSSEPFTVNKNQDPIVLSVKNQSNMPTEEIQSCTRAKYSTKDAHDCDAIMDEVFIHQQITNASDLDPNAVASKKVQLKGNSPSNVAAENLPTFKGVSDFF